MQAMKNKKKCAKFAIDLVFSVKISLKVLCVLGVPALRNIF